MILATLWMILALICVTKGAYAAAAVLIVGAGFYGRSSV